MKIIGLQFDLAWENKGANFATVGRMLGAAPPPQGALVVLPEMFATGFSMNAGAIAEPAGGETEQFLARLAQQWGIYLLAGAAKLGRDNQARNKALVFSPGGELVVSYAKRRLFSPGGEHHHYRPGERPVVFEIGECRVAPLVCYDLRFPELFREIAAVHRPELYVVIANFPAKRTSHWLRLLQARAIENQAYVIGVNRIGSDPFYDYEGRSVIADPQGEIIADGGTIETTVSADLDLILLRKYREGLPFLNDLRLK
jgi:predicted amidohydrolase